MNLAEHSITRRVLDPDDEEVATKTGPYLQQLETIDEQSFARMEKSILVSALRKTMNNKKRAADLLGIDNSTLWRKMKKFNIET